MITLNIKESLYRDLFNKDEITIEELCEYKLKKLDIDDFIAKYDVINELNNDNILVMILPHDDLNAIRMHVMMQQNLVDDLIVNLLIQDVTINNGCYTVSLRLSSNKSIDIYEYSKFGNSVNLLNLDYLFSLNIDYRYYCQYISYQLPGRLLNYSVDTLYESDDILVLCVHYVQIVIITKLTKEIVVVICNESHYISLNMISNLINNRKLNIDRVRFKFRYFDDGGTIHHKFTFDVDQAFIVMSDIIGVYDKLIPSKGMTYTLFIPGYLLSYNYDIIISKSFIKYGSINNYGYFKVSIVSKNSTLNSRLHRTDHILI